MLTAGAYGSQMPSPAPGVNHHSTDLRPWLEQAGVSKIDKVRLEPTLFTADPIGDLEKAKQRARWPF